MFRFSICRWRFFTSSSMSSASFAHFPLASFEQPFSVFELTLIDHTCSVTCGRGKSTRAMTRLSSSIDLGTAGFGGLSLEVATRISSGTSVVVEEAAEDNDKTGNRLANCVANWRAWRKL